jgi:hypothetical protein
MWTNPLWNTKISKKKKKIETTPNERNQQKKMFLLSLLPEIEPMTNAQMISFRRRVLQLIDDILNPAPYLQLSLPQLINIHKQALLCHHIHH